MPVLTLAVLVFVLLIVPWKPVHAFWNPLDADNWATLAANGALAILSLLGRLMGFIIDMILTVASYNDFIKAPAVVSGWKVVRDIGNMTFIIALLMIGFGTMFGMQKFEIGQWLPKVALYSILVNFSRTICGVLIDASQVVMLTFVNAFKEAGAGNFVNAMGLDKIVALAENKADQGGNVTVEVLIAILLGVVVTTLALGVLGALLVFLLERVIGLWILVTLSPVAFILKAIPLDGAASLASQWWKKFLNYLTSGPILAFFLWLALAISSGVGPEADKNLAELQGFKTGQGNAQSSEFGEDSLVGAGDLISGIGNAQGLLSFIISAAMLVAGMTVAKKSGSFAGSFVGKFQGKGALGAIGLGAGGIGRKIASFGTGPLGWGAMMGGSYAQRTAKGFVKPFQEAWKSYKESPAKRGERWATQVAGQFQGIPVVGKHFKPQSRKAIEDADTEAKEDTDADKLEDTQLLRRIAEGVEKGMNPAKLKQYLEEALKRRILKDDPEGRNRQGVDTVIEYLRNAPKLLESFESNLKKASDQLMIKTLYNGFADKADADKFLRDVRVGDVDLGKTISRMDDASLAQLLTHVNGEEGLIKFAVSESEDDSKLKAFFDRVGRTRSQRFWDAIRPGLIEKESDWLKLIKASQGEQLVKTIGNLAEEGSTQRIFLENAFSDSKIRGDNIKDLNINEVAGAAREWLFNQIIDKFDTGDVRRIFRGRNRDFFNGIRDRVEIRAQTDTDIRAVDLKTAIDKMLRRGGGGGGRRRR